MRREGRRVTGNYQSERGSGREGSPVTGNYQSEKGSPVTGNYQGEKGKESCDWKLPE